MLEIAMDFLSADSVNLCFKIGKDYVNTYNLFTESILADFVQNDLYLQQHLNDICKKYITFMLTVLLPFVNNHHGEKRSIVCSAKSCLHRYQSCIVTLQQSTLHRNVNTAVLVT